MSLPVESSNPAPAKSALALKWALLLLPLGYLWFHLIRNLWLEWDTNPQYSYGLVVPILIVGLLGRRWLHFPGCRQGSAVNHPWLAILSIALLALLFFPTRLIEGATPEWRPLQWSLGITTTGLTLAAVYLAGGKNWLKLVAFPVVFFLVAIPWPSLIEQPIIQGLSRMNASMVVEVMGVVGIPAMQHGNVIEVSTGMVGINDACSGIRSFQSSLMIALFLGEFFMFSQGRRWLLVPIGFILAMTLNLGRASLLTWIAATKGIAAIEHYHDQAGLSIMLACTACLWLAAWLLNRKKGHPAHAVEPQPVAASQPTITEISFRRLKPFAMALIVWLVAVEIGVEIWYRVRESNLKPGPTWTANFPEANPTFKEIPLTPEEHVLLRFDQGKKGQWQEADGTSWQGFYFNWLPGKVAGYLAKRHTPDICLTASGLKQVAGPDLVVLTVNGVTLPFRHYVFESANGPLQIYQCHWEAGQGSESFTAEESSRFNLIRGVWAGRGNQGQKVMELILSGYDDAAQARAALERHLETLITVGP